MGLEYSKEKITTPDLTPEKMKISIENVNKLIGLDLKEKDLEKLLPKMGLDYKNKKVLIPAWRTDILHEVDLIEDVAIAYGYDKLVPEIPNVSTIGEEDEESKFKTKLKEVLTGLGLIEVLSYHLIKKSEAKIMKLGEKIEVMDSKTDYKFLRPNLLVPALRILSENKDHDYPQKIFEIGTVFSRGKSETGIEEKENLIVAMSPANFTEIKQVLDYLMGLFGKKYVIKEGERGGLIDGRTGVIEVSGRKIGYVGEVHPETLRAWGMKMSIAVMEINIKNYSGLILK
jgi:phenylalanyl-tRNA synthetase beta chain